MPNLVETGVVVITSGDSLSSIVGANGDGLTILSSTGQIVAGVASVNPATAIATAPAAAIITTMKIIVDLQNGATVSPGDILNVSGNIVGVIAVVGIGIGVGSVTIPAATVIGGSLAVAGAIWGSANSGAWPSFIEDARLRFIPGYATERAMIDVVVNTANSRARNWTQPRDPLVLDLDGNGITTSAINPNAPILFDMDGDGTKTGTGWIGVGEAYVVRDLNGNGTIDSGRELFGDSTLLTSPGMVGTPAANGFAALADLDSNADGKFDASDTAFASVKLWKDLNQDGISQAGELFSFADQGVASINVTGTASTVNLLDANGQPTGNTQPLSGTFTRTNGTTGTSGVAEMAGSLLLANNNFYREFTDDPQTTPAAASLPQMQGSGVVRGRKCYEFRSCNRTPYGRWERKCCEILNVKELSGTYYYYSQKYTFNASSGRIGNRVTNATAL